MSCVFNSARSRIRLIWTAVRPTITSLRLLTVLTVGFKYARMFRKLGAERRAPRPDGLLTYFASPRGEKSGLQSRCIQEERVFTISAGGAAWRL